MFQTDKQSETKLTEILAKDVVVNHNKRKETNHMVL
jgi:hypothetical protein